MNKHSFARWLGISLTGLAIVSCNDSSSKSNSVSAKENRDQINLTLSDEPPTLDPTLSGDSISARVAHDFFEGLVTLDQNNNPIPGLAESWTIGTDRKTYTFKLRDNLKFSDGSPITAEDVLKSWQRLANPKTGATQPELLEPIVNGAAITQGKLPVTALGVTATDNKTIIVRLAYPKAAFLSSLSSPGFDVVPLKVIAANGGAWVNPKNIVTSGAYIPIEHVMNGYIMAKKNPYYWDAANVRIPKVHYAIIKDLNSAYSQYQIGSLDMTDTLPADSYREIQKKYPDELVSVQQEAISFYDYNMLLPKFKDNLKLRQALSMAIDRETIAQQVLGQGQVPLYGVVSQTVAGGAYRNDVYEWESWTMPQRLAQAKKLYAEAGYSANNPLTVTISYNTLDKHRKVALAIASMWKNTLGVNTELNNQEWKIFIKTRVKGDYEIARDAWIAGKDITDYLDFSYLCHANQNNSHYCNPEYDRLVQKADRSSDPAQAQQLYHQAIQIVLKDYPIIPIVQSTYYRLVKPYVHGYDPSNNHTDELYTKWFYF